MTQKYLFFFEKIKELVNGSSSSSNSGGRSKERNDRTIGSNSIF